MASQMCQSWFCWSQLLKMVQSKRYHSWFMSAWLSESVLRLEIYSDKQSDNEKSLILPLCTRTHHWLSSDAVEHAVKTNSGSTHSRCSCCCVPWVEIKETQVDVQISAGGRCPYYCLSSENFTFFFRGGVRLRGVFFTAEFKSNFHHDVCFRPSPPM